MHKQHIHPSMFNNQDLILILFQAHEISKLCHALWRNVLIHKVPLCVCMLCTKPSTNSTVNLFVSDDSSNFSTSQLHVKYIPFLSDIPLCQRQCRCKPNMCISC